MPSLGHSVDDSKWKFEVCSVGAALMEPSVGTREGMGTRSFSGDVLAKIGLSVKESPSDCTSVVTIVGSEAMMAHVGRDDS